MLPRKGLMIAAKTIKTIKIIKTSINYLKENT
jgi:hypothetical protein